MILRLFLIISLTFIFSANTAADTLVLKSGNTIDGDIVEENKDFILINTYGIPVRYYIDEILSVQRGLAENEVKQAAGQEASPANDLEDQNRSKVYLKSLKDIDENTDQQIASVMRSFDIAKMMDDRQEAVKVVLDGIKMLEATIAQIKQLNAPEELKDLKERMTAYYQSMMKVQEEVFKSISGEGNGDPVSFQLASEEMMKMENGFYTDFNRMLDQYGFMLADPKGPSSSYSFDQQQKVGNLQEEISSLKTQNKILVEETRQLVDINKKLQRETKMMIDDNKKLRENMVNAIEKVMEYMDQKQKADFKQYLQTAK